MVNIPIHVRRTKAVNMVTILICIGPTSGPIYLRHEGLIAVCLIVFVRN